MTRLLQGVLAAALILVGLVVSRLEAGVVWREPVQGKLI